MVAKYGLLMLMAVLSSATELAPCECTTDLIPVCGSDGQTYGNQCLLDCAVYTGKQITKESDGFCKRVVKRDVCTCILEYEPVCGSNGRTYPNECALECEKAVNNPELRMAHNGECND